MESRTFEFLKYPGVNSSNDSFVLLQLDTSAGSQREIIFHQSDKQVHALIIVRLRSSAGVSRIRQARD